jgi:hypothetical protein
MPAWNYSSSHSLDFAKIQRSYDAVRMYALGGRFNSPDGGNSGQSGSDDQTAFAQQQLALLQAINDKLSHPTRAWVSLTDLNSQQNRLNQIIDDATMR